MKITLGCDPELFLADVHGNLRASCGLIGGTKRQPMPLPLGEGYAVQEDNVAIEFNIPPASGAAEFVRSVTNTVMFLREEVATRHSFQILNSSAEVFPDSELVAPASREFGCDPDYNAWTRKRNPRPKATDANLRSCGGHVHVGFDFQKLEREQVIKTMDLYLGVPSVLMDKGDLRKQLYGKGGAFRITPFGVEYRTMSNFWVLNERLVQWVWDNSEKAVNAVESQFVVDDYRDSILDAIDNNNKEVAAQLVQQFNLEVVHV